MNVVSVGQMVQLIPWLSDEEDHHEDQFPFGSSNFWGTCLFFSGSRQLVSFANYIFRKTMFYVNHSGGWNFFVFSSLWTLTNYKIFYLWFPLFPESTHISKLCFGKCNLLWKLFLEFYPVYILATISSSILWTVERKVY